MTKNYRIALAGNPNSGKTSLFNALTGLRYKVANYPGVTVEKKQGNFTLPNIGEVEVIDLPGTYNLAGSSLDEKIAENVLTGNSIQDPKPELVVCVVDATNLERNLYLTTQLIDLGLPIVLALNMSDVAAKRGISVKREVLSRLLDIPVVAIVASQRQGLEELKQEIVKQLQTPIASRRLKAWLPKDQTAIDLSQMNGEEASLRFRWINSIVRQSVAILHKNTQNITSKLDRLLTHRVWGLAIFILIMSLVFQSIFVLAEAPMQFIEGLVTNLGNFVGQQLAPGVVKSLIVDGVIAGAGSVLMFIPQIAILFLMLGILEDSGYLSRAAFLMDKLMRKIGLQGRSFIPLLSSFACAIPGIMSTRTIPSFGDRITTIMIAPLMSCSARLPVYTVLIAAFIPQRTFLHFFSLQGAVLLSMYLLGIIAAVLVAWGLRLTLLKGSPSMFVMEMPPFRLPDLKMIGLDVWDRVSLFVKNAGTVILACTILLWLLASFPRNDNGASHVRDSFAGKIGTAIEPIIAPLGYNWEVGIGILASFAAREVFVSSLATVYNIESETDAADSLVQMLKTRREKKTGLNTIGAISLMVFYVFACMCMSTLAVCKRETGSWKWTALMFTYMTTLGYVAALLVYQFGSAIWG